MVKISTVIELLVLCLLIAFAASRVIDPIDGARGLANDHHGLANHKTVFRKSRQEVDVPNRFCKCSSLSCNCCRDFSLPVVPIKGPGCAMIRYVNDDKISITMSFGDRVLRNITVNGKSPKPVCMGLPGGISKFCGKVYGINRDGDQFKACLGLELRALDDVEAALRVSCFRFGPQGLNLEPGQPVPVDEEDEDEDDDYGLDDDEDDDDDDDFGLGDDEDDDDEATANDADNDVDSDESDYTGFSALSEEFLGDFFGSDSGTKKKPVIKQKDPVPLTNTVVKPVKPVTVNTVKKPIKTQNQKPLTTTQGTRKPVKRPIAPSPSVVKKPAAVTVQTPTKLNKDKDQPVTATAITITVEQDGQKLDDVKKPQVVKDDVLTNIKVKPEKLDEKKPALVGSIKRPVAMSKPVVKVEQINKEPPKIQENTSDKESPSKQSVISTPIIQSHPEETSNKPVENKPEKQNTINENQESKPVNKVNTIITEQNIEVMKPAIEKSPTNEKNQMNTEVNESQDQITTEQSNTGITSVQEDETQTEKENSESATQSVMSDEGSDKVEAITENSSANKDENSSYEEDDEDIGVSILDDEDDEEDEEEPDTAKQESTISETTKEDIIPEEIKPEKKDADDEEDDDDLLGGILDDDEDDEDEEEKERKIEAPFQVNPLLYQLASISVGNTAQARQMPPLSPFYRSSRTHKRMRLPPIDSPANVS